MSKIQELKNLRSNSKHSTSTINQHNNDISNVTNDNVNQQTNSIRAIATDSVTTANTNSF